MLHLVIALEDALGYGRDFVIEVEGTPAWADALFRGMFAVAWGMGAMVWAVKS